MAKKIAGYIKLQIPAGKANPSPPVGPALGQRGLNIMQFCKDFNAATQNMEPGMPVPVVITAFADRTFSFITKTPPNTYFLMKAAKIDKGSQTVGKSAPVGPADHVAVARDRRAEDEGHERQRRGRGGADADRAPLARWASRWWRAEPWRKDKRLQKAYENVDTAKSYPLADAIKLVKQNAKAKFDETVEMSMNLGIDPRHADQMVRGLTSLPNGTGKTVRVRGVRTRAEGGGGPGGRCRCGRRRGPRREGSGWRDRVRPLHRDAGHDGRGRAGWAKSSVRAG